MPEKRVYIGAGICTLLLLVGCGHGKPTSGEDSCSLILPLIPRGVASLPKEAKQQLSALREEEKTRLLKQLVSVQAFVAAMALPVSEKGLRRVRVSFAKRDDGQGELVWEGRRGRGKAVFELVPQLAYLISELEVPEGFWKLIPLPQSRPRRNRQQESSTPELTPKP